MTPAYQPASDTNALGQPDVVVSARDLFKIDTDLQVPAFSSPDEHVPPLDPDYVFDRDTTLALLAGFVHNRRVMVQGRHGTGKSSHVEQVASRLNWPCVRVNLDGHVSRMDLIGKDAIVVRDGKQVTEFQPGILTWALQRPCALVFDEYDAGRADVMFVIQRVLEVEGRLTLLDQSRVIEPHPSFRLFATANTVGLGDATGLYHGTQPLNQGQMDRWNIVVTLNYLEHDREVDVVLARCPEYRNAGGPRAGRRDGGAGQPDAARVRRRRPLDGHVAAHGRHLGAEHHALPRRRPGLQAHVPQPLRRGRARTRRRVLPALHRAGPSRGSARARPQVSSPFPDKTVEAVGACTRALGRLEFADAAVAQSDAATLSGLRAFGDRLALRRALS